MKESQMSSECNKYGTEEKYIQVFGLKHLGNRLLGELILRERTVLKWYF
jgi:hypothetical protein